jgi:hypothetical protein
LSSGFIKAREGHRETELGGGRRTSRGQTQTKKGTERELTENTNQKQRGDERTGEKEKEQTREDITEGKPDAGSGIIASSQNPSDKLRRDFTQRRL